MEPLPALDVRAVGDAYLLDVREQHEWAAGHAPGAVHVPLGELAARVAEVPRDSLVAVVCRSGHRSAQAAAWLAAHGYRAANVADGMQAWEAAGLPMEADGAAPPRVA